MLKIPAPAHSLRFDENNQELSIIGALRPQHDDDMRNCIEMLRDAVSRVRGTLYINVKRLVRLNNIAFRALASSVVAAATERSDLKLVIVTSSVVGWATKKFRPLMQVNPRIVVEEYDADFYPGQAFVEDSDIIGLLRTQTNMTWRHEQGILPRHGLKPGMAVADICCGIGDFAVLLHKAFAPGRMVALDHSRPSLDYARGVAEEFGISGIEYVYGDASEMLLEDNQFDFVTCRHALQVFDRPELILKELFRICKPGGRVYVTNEKNSHCLGEPRGESIQWTYNEVAKILSYFNHDIEIGPKSRRLMMDAGFSNVRMESFMVTNMDGDPQDFADIITAWRDLFAGKMSQMRGDDEAFTARFRQGFDDHIFAALHPKGYAGWPIWVASGTKPL